MRFIGFKQNRSSKPAEEAKNPWMLDSAQVKASEGMISWMDGVSSHRDKVESALFGGIGSGSKSGGRDILFKGMDFLA